MNKEQQFTEHLQTDRSFADLAQCSYEKRIVVFKFGYANFEYHTQKKILMNLIILFHKFKNFDNLYISIPAKDDNDNFQVYHASVERKEFFDFIIDKIEHKQADITDVNTFMHKKTVLAFAEKFVFTQPF
jgi:hypothetical protein